MKLPTISFIIPTFNSEKTIEVCLLSIFSQEYPKSNIEVIFGDGGSKDRTLQIAKKYNVKIVTVTSKKQGPEYNRASAAHKATGEILAFLDHDNILPHPLWLSKMVTPFLVDKEIVGVETLRYAYDPKDPPLARYFSLLCANDVLPFYLGKADRISYMFDSPKDYGVYKKAKVEEKETYYQVLFARDEVPTLGSNGFLIQKSLLFAHAKTDPELFFHIDVNVDLIRKGFKKYALVKDTIIHGTSERGIINYLKRRALFVGKYHLQDMAHRRYSVYEKKDFFRLLVFLVIALTFVKTFIDSLRGFMKVRDAAWFLHPIITFLLFIVYAYTITAHYATKYGKKLF